MASIRKYSMYSTRVLKMGKNIGAIVWLFLLRTGKTLICRG